jgi:hypothetical protein
MNTSAEISSPIPSTHLRPHSPVSGTDSASQTLMDRIGIALSGLCMVHCLVLPMLVPFLTTLSVFAESEMTHFVLAALIVPTVAFSAWSGYSKHGKSIIVCLLASGTLAVVIAMFAGEHFSSEPLEAGMTTLGSVLLIAGHWQNHKHRAICDITEPHKH